MPDAHPEMCANDPDPCVLVVDDDASQRLLMQAALEHGGIRVQTVESGREMHAFCLAQRPCLVLMDLNVGAESGVHLAQEMQARYQVAAIMVSGVPEDELRAAMRQAQAVDCLSKPLDVRRLLAVVQARVAQACAGRLARDAAASPPSC